VTPKISIIVPVYKVEQYLPKCIESIISQTYTNWELILVNDGSPDSSGEICDRYAAKDSRIRVFHKPNGGVSSARNKGVEMALGDYAIHVDPDDWIEIDMLKKLVSMLSKDKVDLIIFDYITINGLKTQTVKQCPTKLNAKNVLYDLFGNIHGSCCNKLISKEYYKRIKFYEQVSICEDLLYIFQVLQMNPKIGYLNDALYNYRLDSNDSSLSKIMSAKKFLQLNMVLDILIELSENEYNLSDAIYRRQVPHMAYVGLKAVDLDGCQYRKVLLPYTKYIVHSKQPIGIRIMSLMAICGFKKITNLFFKIKHWLK